MQRIGFDKYKFDVLHDINILDFDTGESVTIIGNGEGALPDAIPGLCILFNQRNYMFLKKPSKILRILNSRTTFPASESGEHVVILSAGKQSEYSSLSVQFQEVATDLSEQLGCWPSCGLVALFWALGRGFEVSCYQMSLSPALSRERNWSTGYAPPTMYHNYLGERRLALSQLNLASTKVVWPEILPPGREPSVQLEPSFSTCLFDELRGLQVTNAPLKRRRKQLERLVSQLIMEPSDALAAAGDSGLENFFYLPRDVRRTENWWLYDYEASLTIERLVAVLRHYQQTIYLNRPEPPPNKY